MACTPIITYISDGQALDNFKSTSVHQLSLTFREAPDNFKSIMACKPVITYVSDRQALDNSKSIMTCTKSITYISAGKH